MKKPAPPAPSWVTVPPAANRRSRICEAISCSSRSSSPEKSGTRFSTSVEALATALLYTVCNESRRNRQDRPVHLTVIGCSPAWPNAGGAQSGYLVEGDGHLLLHRGPGVPAALLR